MKIKAQTVPQKFLLVRQFPEEIFAINFKKD